jgi:hypothetical protein
LPAQSRHRVRKEIYRVRAESFREANYHEESWRPQPTFEQRWICAVEIAFLRELFLTDPA